MTPVATTERVSRYTQNVSANQRNELVTPVIRVLTTRRRKIRSVSAEVIVWVGIALSSVSHRIALSVDLAVGGELFVRV